MPVSSSERPADLGGQEAAFTRLHPAVQDLVRHHLGWRALRAVQVHSVEPVIAARDDVLIIAGTASGKTEAAWLPVFSRLLADATGGVGVLCISPMKALIDDQVRRLGRYGEYLRLRIEAWHGDVAASRKHAVLDSPPAALIITPESLQSLLMRRPTELLRALVPLRYVIVDEVHALAGTDRGQQLQSLLHQIETRLNRRVPRVALSATVSVPEAVNEYLRPGGGAAVRVVRVRSSGLNLDVRLFGVYRGLPRIDPHDVKDADTELKVSDVATADRLQIVRRIDETSRGRRSLVFTKSRTDVEALTALLRDETVTGSRRGERFLAHHGSLSAEMRRAAERALFDHPDAGVVCTSTLELGVDLPDLDQVVQVDAAPSVASLRQRLGRSGRRAGTRPTLRVYATEQRDPKPGSTLAELRVGLVQAMATIELIIRDDWVEPTDLAPLGLSTLAHQTLVLAADVAGVRATDAWRLLCQTGPWRRVDAPMYAQLLRGLAAQQLIRQDERGRVILDEAGQQLVGHRDFLAVFDAAAEYAVRHKGRLLGSVPARVPLRVGSNLVFAGRTWRVVAVNASGWRVDVEPHTHGLPAKFMSNPGGVHREVRQKMRHIYESTDVPEYLDGPAAEMLAAGRATYAQMDLHRRAVVPATPGSLVAAWAGDREHVTLERWLQRLRPHWQVAPGMLGPVVNAEPGQVRAALTQLAAEPTPDPLDLAADVLTKASAKFDRLLPEPLLLAECASRMIDVEAARQVLATVLDRDRLAAAGRAQPPTGP